MKKIVLIGDSIRKGYDAYVQEKLAGQAQVFFPEENCRFAQYVYLNLLGWKMDGNRIRYTFTVPFDCELCFKADRPLKDITLNGQQVLEETLAVPFRAGSYVIEALCD